MAGKPWYDYPVYSDYPWSTYHNTDVGDPPDTILTAPTSGTITDIGYFAWGGQVTYREDHPTDPQNPYVFLIHLDAINPNLRVGQRIQQGAFLGYSGGQTSNAGMPSLPAGYTHHATSPAHSTGPHLDIGVTNSPTGSLDRNQSASNALVALARKLKIPYGVGGISPQTNAGGEGTQAMSTTYTRRQWAIDLLHYIGNPNPDESEIEFVTGWTWAETNPGPGARFNPLNTTQYEPGATAFNTFGSSGQYHVWNEPSYQLGLKAEGDTLENGLYPSLLQALRNPGTASDKALGFNPSGNTLVPTPTGQPSPGVIANLETWGTHDWQAIYNHLSGQSASATLPGTPTGSSGQGSSGGGVAPDIATDPCAGLGFWDPRLWACRIQQGTSGIVSGTVQDVFAGIQDMLANTEKALGVTSLVNLLERGAAMGVGLGMMGLGVWIALVGMEFKAGIPQKAIRVGAAAAGSPSTIEGLAAQASARERAQVQQKRQAASNQQARPSPARGRAGQRRTR